MSESTVINDSFIETTNVYLEAHTEPFSLTLWQRKVGTANSLGVSANLNQLISNPSGGPSWASETIYIVNTVVLQDEAAVCDIKFISTIDVNLFVGIVLRYQDNDNFYFGILNYQHLQIWKRIAGEDTMLADYDAAYLLNQFYHLRFTVTGLTLKAYINSALILTAYDENPFILSGGQIGIYTNRSNAGENFILENFQAVHNTESSNPLRTVPITDRLKLIQETLSIRKVPTPTGTLATDSFTDSDGTKLEDHISDSGHSWTFLGGITNAIRSNGLALDDPEFNTDFEYEYQYTPGDDVEVVIKLTGSLTILYVILRGHYSFELDMVANKAYIRKDGVEINNHSPLNSFSSNRFIRFSISGNTLKIDELFSDGSLDTNLLTETDSTYTSAAKPILGAKVADLLNDLVDVDYFKVGTIGNAFSSPTAQDNFTGTNGTTLEAHTSDTGEGWVKLGYNTAHIFVNHCRCDFSAEPKTAMYEFSLSPPADIQVDIVVSGDNGIFWIILRDHYYVVLNPVSSLFEIYRDTTLLNSVAWEALTTFSAFITGDNIKFIADGVDKISVTDATYAMGAKVKIGGYGNSMSPMDNFGITGFGGGGSGDTLEIDIIDSLAFDEGISIINSLSVLDVLNLSDKVAFFKYIADNLGFTENWAISRFDEETSDVIPYSLKILDSLEFSDNMSVAALISLVDALDIHDVVKAMVKVLLTENLNFTETLKFTHKIFESLNFHELLGILSSLPTLQDRTKLTDSISIKKGLDPNYTKPDYEEPEFLYTVQKIKYLLCVQPRKVR